MVTTYQYFPKTAPKCKQAAYSYNNTFIRLQQVLYRFELYTYEEGKYKTACNTNHVCFFLKFCQCVCIAIHTKIVCNGFVPTLYIHKHLSATKYLLTQVTLHTRTIVKQFKNKTY